MKLSNRKRIRLLLVGFVAAIVLSGGSVNAEIIMSEPANLGPVINDAYDVQESDFSNDGLQLYFAVWNRPDGFGSGDIYMAERETLSSPWQEPVNLGPNVNSSGKEIEPCISSDGLELYFGSWDDYILRVCTRTSKDAPWSSPVKIGPPVGSNEPAMEIGSNDAYGPDISADDLSLYFASTRVGGHGSDDIWVATRETLDAPWGEPVNLGPNVNTSSSEWAPSISTDGLTLVFSRELQSIWATTRKSIHDEWGPAVRLGISGPGNFFSPALSPDGSTLYFQAVNGWGGYGKNDFWQVNFVPIVDFNSDGIVDSLDMCIMCENWHMNSTRCDIAPLPFGDGFVDVQDMVMLSEYLFPGLAAHWKLDEQSGDIAHSSTGENDAVVIGGAVWQPDSGQIDGALELNGVDGCAIAGQAINPADGPFSVIAWINGGAPGQVIVSQQATANWLAIDAEGNLMTELKSSEQLAGPLVSETIITDGQWHRIGLVWDDSHRMLFIDGVMVAEDTQDGLEGSVNGLYIGAGKLMQPGTFFSGLIDDVRIYNVALTADEIAALAQ
jgi:hypothetical protein